MIRTDLAGLLILAAYALGMLAGALAQHLARLDRDTARRNAASRRVPGGHAIVGRPDRRHTDDPAADGRRYLTPGQGRELQEPSTQSLRRLW